MTAEDRDALADFVRRCQAYLDDAPGSGGHSDAAGSNAYELIQEAIEHFRAPPAAEGAREINKGVARNAAETANRLCSQWIPERWLNLFMDAYDDISACRAAPPSGSAVAMRSALEAAKAAMLRTRTASIAGCEEGYGKPELWGEELFASHGDLTKAIKLCDAALADPQPQEGEHIYSPDYQAMGDCRVCGHEQDSVRHIGTPKHASLTRPHRASEGS